MCFQVDVGAMQAPLPCCCLEALSCTLFLDCAGGSLDMVSLGEIAFWSLEGGDTFSCPEGNDTPSACSHAVIHAVCVAHRHKRMACFNPSSHCTVSAPFDRQTPTGSRAHGLRVSNDPVKHLSGRSCDTRCQKVVWPLTSDRWRKDFSAHHPAPLPLFNQPGSTLSLLHVSQWPHPPFRWSILPG